MILYSGPSQIDGQPIVCIATGFESASVNHKTGPMIQTWILRSDIAPEEAVRTGGDSSICGSCHLRGLVTKLPNGEQINRFRGCYVFVQQAPQKIWEQRLEYKAMDLSKFAGQMVRIGSYGDPCAVPFEVWRQVASKAAGRTGYTHQWREKRFEHYRSLLMASVETEEDASQARSKGWRTFRVAPHGALPMAGEFHCPASKEQSYRETCESCGACDGADNAPDRASVVIYPHGPPAAVKSFYRVTLGASKTIDHRKALTAFDTAVLRRLETTGAQSASELGTHFKRGTQSMATRLWHMRQIGVVRRESRGVYVATT